MFIALAIGFFFLGSIATLFIFIAPAMLSSQISREEEAREIVINKQLTFKNQVIIDAEFEESADDLVRVAPHSSGLIRIADYSPQSARKAATGHRKIDLYV